jgi:predicted  nucleic acid-binding Zn-ribbon protein
MNHNKMRIDEQIKALKKAKAEKRKLEAEVEKLDKAILTIEQIFRDGDRSRMKAIAAYKKTLLATPGLAPRRPRFKAER